MAWYSLDEDHVGLLLMQCLEHVTRSSRRSERIGLMSILVELKRIRYNLYVWKGDTQAIFKYAES
jgi:hypothetical protein